jgi:integrase/recombinase XerD
MILPTLASLVQHFLCDYLENQRKAAINTQKNYAECLKQFLSFLATRDSTCIGELTADTLTTDNVLAFLRYLSEERNNGPRTRNQRLAVLKAFFRVSSEHSVGLLFEAQRVRAIVRQKAPTSEVAYLSTADVQTIIQAVPDSDTLLGARDSVMLQLLYGTGARVSEAAGIKLSDLDLVGKAPSVILHGKGNKTRIIPLRAVLVAAIKRYLALRETEGVSSKYLLASSRGEGPITRSAISRRLARFLQVAECEVITTTTQAPITAHTFRHSLATHLIESGCDLLQVRDLLGHASIQTTNVYLRASLAHKRTALEGLHSEEVSEGAQAAIPQWRKPEVLVILDRTIRQALCCQS